MQIFSTYNDDPSKNIQADRLMRPLISFKDKATTFGGRVVRRTVVFIAAIPVLALGLIEGLGKLLIMAPIGHFVGPKGRTGNRLKQAAISLSAVVLVPYWILTDKDAAQRAAQ